MSFTWQHIVGLWIPNLKGSIHDGTESPSSDNSSIERVNSSDRKQQGEVAERPAVSDAQVPNEAAQDGVTAVEAITLTWTKTTLGTAYILMWLLYFVNAFQSSITSNLSAYVTSAFASHSLLPVISVVSSVMGAACYMPLAKILNLFDRSVGFAAMVIFATIGLILSATCNDIETYCASQVFYTIGFTGMTFCIDVITADTSTLRDRGLAYAFTSSPYIITAFAGASASQHFYEFNWRWAYGCFAIVLPVVATPYFVLLRYNRHLAKKRGLLRPKERSGRTFMQSVWYYIIQFDLVGTFLLAAGLVMILLPFTIAGSAADGWSQGYIIALLVLGFCCLVAFALSERYLAPVPFIPWEILVSRTVIGACLLDVCYQVAYYCWFDYYTSYLQVVFYTSIELAGYTSSIFDVVSGVWLFVVGFAIKKTGRFRWILFWAVPVYILFEGLMIYFRKPGAGYGYQVMCQIFIAFAGGAMIICQQVAVLAAADHNNVASALAVLGVFGNIGGAIGGSISGAIWTNTLPQKLQEYLPAATVGDWETIYDDLATQLSYEKGTPTRIAIQKAYAIAQQNMLIAGTAVMASALIWMVVIKDLKLTRTQAKGVLF
ncbi:Siderophore iron transporter mirB [Pseudocercospora fuligena]|uniref:Siderophore iron transporter mirB n=1 Tax=Pseudocercospora fuligena TaxID=685502 RepID=A0A8H6RMA4_9PEZI|nr:Siderophore iron transporter mirB [Pseudocercospora fuligena]